ncbi:hypothetical protein HU200_048789 [Digitaria exilis]|uniref:KIB1-4 beta-propeller domain-containing protein n=1 Tax=Digitaria exilis TaxID=1010633 RepID=A0A835E8Y9_9POAL|nr:hypothetical protein HU200_048789 [Digitaria exilis]
MEEAPLSRLPLSWLDIPVELAGMVLGRLPAHVDRVRFAAVCPQWRLAAQHGGLPPPMPLLLLPDSTVYSLPGSGPFHFPSCAGYTDACGDWLVFSGEDGCFLRDPFSNATVTLPPLSRFRVQYVGHESVLSADELHCASMEMGEELVASKIIFCSPHLVAAIVKLRIEGPTRIAVCQPGATSYWSVRVDLWWVPLFLDIVFYQGKLYSVTSIDRLFAVDISVDHSTGDPSVSQFQELISDMLGPQYMVFEGFLILKMSYLDESRGVLLLVCRMIYLRLKPGPRIEVVAAEQNRFEVYEANFEQSRWAEVTTLGDDQVLFLRQRCCRSVSVSHKDVPRDCIFFLENDVDDPHWYGSGSPGSWSVYSMRDSKVTTPLPAVSWKHATVFATWLFPQG